MSRDRPSKPACSLSRRALQAGGQPISELMAQALSHPELISLAAGFVDQATLPVTATRGAFEAVMSDAQQATRRCNTAPPRLRRCENNYGRSCGRRFAARRLGCHRSVVISGSNQLLHMLADTLLDPGDIVLARATYFVFLGVLANLGARSIGVEMDEQGLVPEALEATLAKLEKSGELARVKAIYCTSYFDNPSSVSLSIDRRPQLVEIAERWSRAQRIYIIEDAAYRELRYTGDDPPSLRAFDSAGETVIVAGTFSKSFSPGARVGWGVAPKSLVAPLCEQKGNLDFGSPNFMQHIMHEVLRQGLYDPHIELLRDAYREKLATMLSAAEEHLAGLPDVRWLRPSGGLYVWLTLPDCIDTGPAGGLFERAVRQGVLYVPGQYCYPGEGPCQQNTIRLGFGVQSPAQIRRGMRMLAQAIQEELSD